MPLTHHSIIGSKGLRNMKIRNTSTLLLTAAAAAALITAPAASARPTCQSTDFKSICQTNGSVSIKARPGTVAPPANIPHMPFFGIGGRR